jgi:deazaflavin-dependent oxidoreductase (nitroreductase family)
VTEQAQEQYFYLTTRGRKSGRPREIEIWFTEREGRFYIVAEYDTSHWLRNLRANPEVQVRVGEQIFSGRARVLNPQADAALRTVVQQLSQAKYGWSDGTVVEISPISTNSSVPSE